MEIFEAIQLVTLSMIWTLTLSELLMMRQWFPIQGERLIQVMDKNCKSTLKGTKIIPRIKADNADLTKMLNAPQWIFATSMLAPFWSTY
jgi:hypothetical protein